MTDVKSILDKVLANVSAASEPPAPGVMERLRADTINSTDGILNQTDGYDCRRCRNRGYTMEVTEDFRMFAKPCCCEPIRKSIAMMKASGLKNIITDYTFEKYHAEQQWQKSVKEAAEAFAKDPIGWFYIGGQSGSGKTHICTAIARELLLRGTEVRYMVWRDEVTKLKSIVNDAESYGKAVDGFKRCKCLYIDDLFKTGKNGNGERQRPTQADINVAFEILNYRYNNPDLITLISSECTITDILEIDEAVCGRIYERAKSAFSLKPDRRRNYRLKGVVET